MHAAPCDQVQQDALNVELLPTARTTAPGHVDRKTCPHSHVDIHEGIYVLSVAKQNPQGYGIDRQGEQADHQTRASPA